MGQDSKGLPACSLFFFSLQLTEDRSENPHCLISSSPHSPGQLKEQGLRMLGDLPLATWQTPGRTGLDPRSLGSEHSVYPTPVSCLSPCPLFSFLYFILQNINGYA